MKLLKFLGGFFLIPLFFLIFFGTIYLLLTFPKTIAGVTCFIICFIMGLVVAEDAL